MNLEYDILVYTHNSAFRFPKGTEDNYNYTVSVENVDVAQSHVYVVGHYYGDLDDEFLDGAFLSEDDAYAFALLLCFQDLASNEPQRLASIQFITRCEIQNPPD